jgi:hypothetical protein
MYKLACLQHLPPPIGRIRCSWNPFYLLYELLGPRVCGCLACCIIVVAIVAVLVFGAPFLGTITSWISLLPKASQTLYGHGSNVTVQQSCGFAVCRKGQRLSACCWCCCCAARPSYATVRALSVA